MDIWVQSQLSHFDYIKQDQVIRSEAACSSERKVEKIQKWLVDPQKSQLCQESFPTWTHMDGTAWNLAWTS